jgi:hypothetical protein
MTDAETNLIRGKVKKLLLRKNFCHRLAKNQQNLKQYRENFLIYKN